MVNISGNYPAKICAPWTAAQLRSTVAAHTTAMRETLFIRERRRYLGHSEIILARLAFPAAALISKP
jgi:hypothetical protein